MSDLSPDARKAFEQWYVEHAFDFEANPIGSRECGLQWTAWAAGMAYRQRVDARTVREHMRLLLNVGYREAARTAATILDAIEEPSP